jgi:hypothetical protein
MRRGWRRLTCPAVLGAMIAVVLTGSAERAHAGSGPDVPLDGWTAATWRDSTPDERRGYLLGLTEGLRLATALDRAQVDRSTVVDCAQGLRAEHLPRLVEDYLDDASLVVNESTASFQVWDALLAVCRDDTPRRGGDRSFWVFVNLRHPVAISRPHLTRAACEAARRTHELVETTGCHLEPVPPASYRSTVPSRAGGHR